MDDYRKKKTCMGLTVDGLSTEDPISGARWILLVTMHNLLACDLRSHDPDITPGAKC